MLDLPIDPIQYYLSPDMDYLIDQSNGHVSEAIKAAKGGGSTLIAENQPDADLACNTYMVSRIGYPTYNCQYCQKMVSVVKANHYDSESGYVQQPITASNHIAYPASRYDNNEGAMRRSCGTVQARNWQWAELENIVERNLCEDQCYEACFEYCYNSCFNTCVHFTTCKSPLTNCGDQCTGGCFGSCVSTCAPNCVGCALSCAGPA